MGVRKMREEDIEVVREIAYASYQTTYKEMLPESVQQDFLSLAYNVERLKQRMKNSHFLVYTQNSKVVAFSNFSTIDKKGKVEMLAIYIEKHNQRKQIGSKFLEYIIKENPTIKEITVSMEANNDGGMNFTRKKGFYCVEQFIEDFQGVYLHIKRMKLYIVKNHESLDQVEGY